MMADVRSPLRIGMILLNNSGSGGAERRYAQVYEQFKRSHVRVFLAINQSLFEELCRVGVLDKKAADLVVREWIGSFSRWLFKDERNSRTSLNGCKHFMQRITIAIAFGLRKLDYALACWSIAWWVLHRRPQILHLILGGVYVVLPLQWLRRAPPALISVVCPSLRAMVGSALGYRLYLKALRSAEAIDALTERIRESLKEEGIPSDHINVSPGSFVDTSRFTPADFRQPWVVFAGRLIPEKNPDQFVTSCALVRERLSHVKFFILGDGPLRPHVEALVKQYGLESHTEIKWCDHTESVLQHACVFVSTQNTDNYPSQALLEAMSCGAAVVATDVGETKKLVDDAVGKLVEAKPEAIAAAVVSLLENPEQAALKGQLGRRRVMEQHSAEAYLNYLEQLYRDLAFPGGAI